VNGACADLAEGGSYVTMKSPGNDYSIMIETKAATASQQLTFHVSGGLSPKNLCVWLSNVQEQFVRQADITPVNGTFTLNMDPGSIYSLSTTTGQQKGTFDNIPDAKAFPFPYYETFDEYTAPEKWGYLPRYTADIADVFEIVDRPDKQGKCLRQVAPIPPNFWAPEYMPYTIIGDAHWKDYEVSADVYLNPGDSAGVMGRVIYVGSGFRNVPKGYFLNLSDTGQCDLVLIRGTKLRKNDPGGDAEQQALFKAQQDNGQTGEKNLGAALVSKIAPNQWHNLKLRFEGTRITGFVDGIQVLSASDDTYSQGMAGLRAGSGKQKLSMPYFDNLWIAPAPQPTSAFPGQSPIYGSAKMH
jgi:galactosylceramidase